MSGPDTFWLTATNILLAAALLTLIAVVLTGVLCDFVASIRARHKVLRNLDREIWDLFHPRG